MPSLHVRSDSAPFGLDVEEVDKGGHDCDAGSKEYEGERLQAAEHGEEGLCDYCRHKLIVVPEMYKDTTSGTLPLPAYMTLVSLVLGLPTQKCSWLCVKGYKCGRTAGMTRSTFQR